MKKTDKNSFKSPLANRKKSFDKYYNYSAETIIKRVLKYAWKSKTLIFVSFLF